jgi:hypothetical protein
MNGAPDLDLREVFQSHEDLADPVAVASLADAAHAQVAAKAGLRPRMTRPTALVASLAAVVALVGTVSGTVALLSGPDRATVLPADPPPVTTGPFAGPAVRLLKLYSDLTAAAEPPALAVSGDLDQSEGQLEPAIGSDYKYSIATGHLTASGPLPTGPARGWVTLPDTSRRVETPLMTADETLAALRGTPRDCQGCADVVVTGAIPTTMDLTVLGGDAEVPAWKFQLAGTSFQLIRAAIPARSLVTLPSDALTPLPGTIPAGSYAVSADGRSLDITFAGSEETGVCGRRYAATAHESSAAVVVAIADVGPVDPTPPTQGQGCDDVGHLRHVTVRLDAPLVERAVLDLAWGRLMPRTGPQPGRVS